MSSILKNHVSHHEKSSGNVGNVLQCPFRSGSMRRSTQQSLHGKRRSPVESSEEGFNGDSMVFHTGFSGDLMAFIWGLRIFNEDLSVFYMGFNGDLIVFHMGFNCDLMGFNGV